MLVGTIFGILVIPVLFIVFQRLQEKIRPKQEETEEETAQ
jgi:HAE1 family hydrophobic/amphiphilic exporter-1